MSNNDETIQALVEYNSTKMENELVEQNTNIDTEEHGNSDENGDCVVDTMEVGSGELVNNNQEKMKRTFKAASHPNFFLAAQITNSTILARLKEVQENICGKNETLRKAAVAIPASHIKLNALNLDGEGVKKVQNILQESRDELRKLLKVNSLKISVDKVGHFGKEVVFADITKDKEFENLKKINKYFSDIMGNFMVERKFKPNIPIMKFAKLRGKKKMKISPKEIYSELENTHFGVEEIRTIQLLSMTDKKDANGYYKCYQEIQLYGEVEENNDEVASENMEVEKRKEDKEEEVITKMRPNFFLASPITNPQILDKLKEVQESMLEKNGNLAKAAVRICTSHITLKVMYLDEEGIRRVQNILQESRDELRKLLKVNSLKISVDKVGHFGKEVVFADITKDKEFENLKKINKYFSEVVSEYDSEPIREFNPHITLMKVGKMRGKKKVKKIEKEIYSELENTHFGVEDIRTIQLLSMTDKKDANGYYKCYQEIQLFDTEEHGNSDENGDCVVDTMEVGSGELVNNTTTVDGCNEEI